MPNQQPPKPTAGATATDDLAGRALADLDSPNETVRARAAQTLVRLEHPRALEACLRTLDDAPDELHLNVTPAVHGLRTIGKPALPPLLDRLETGGEMTRRRAEQAVIWISKLYFGFDGRSWAGDGVAVWSRWWRSIGYETASPEPERRVAVGRLRAWLAADA